MKIFNWMTPRGRAWSLYQRGMAKANRHDHSGAIADYSRTIEKPGVSASLLAMVLFNRALVFVAIGDTRLGRRDLRKVLGMQEGLSNIKAMARQKLLRIENREAKSSA